MQKSDENKWKNFEHLVAAIHKAADQGANVRWNEKINGRQFDVVIRFKKGMYDYVTIVECKDYKKPVSVEKIDALVTKARDVGANNVIMASSSGFQSGAKETAKRHSITLLNISDSDTTDISIFGAKFGELEKRFHIKSTTLVFCNGDKAHIPERADMFTYYAQQGALQKGEERISLDSALQQFDYKYDENKLDDYAAYIIPVCSDVIFVSPDEEIPSGPLKEIHVNAGMIMARTYTGQYQFEPYLLTPDIEVQNVISGEATYFSQHALALGVDTKFEEGKFYENPQLAINYYCEAVNDNLAELILVESFQNGLLLQARIKSKTEYQNRYVEVKDQETVARLYRRLEQFHSRSRNKKT